MHRSYVDIIGRLGPPLWWDGNAVPRYDPFDPDRCGIYAKRIAFIEIFCQNCDRSFKVSLESTEHEEEAQKRYDEYGVGFWGLPKTSYLPTKENLQWWHYGDPPSHDCIGDGMNAITYKILEFWTNTHQED